MKNDEIEYPDLDIALYIYPFVKQFYNLTNLYQKNEGFQKYQSTLLMTF